MVPVSTVSTELSALAALTAMAGLLNAAKVHLYQNSQTPTKNSKLADFTEATFTGYAAVAAGTWGAPYVGIDGRAHVTAPGIQFQPTDAVTPNTIFGAYITNTAGTALIFAVKFDQPIPLPDATSGFVYEPDFLYGS